MKIVRSIGILVAMSSMAMAQWYTVAAAPEVDSNTAITGLALVSGLLLVVKSRLRK